MSATIQKIKDLRVDKFLFCFELEAGTKIISIIFIIIGILALATSPLNSESKQEKIYGFILFLRILLI